MVPFLAGFLGMFICHFFVLLAFGSGVKFPIYIFVYPVVYPLLSVALTLKHQRLWLSNAVLVCTVPFLYWYLLLWTDGKINISSFHLLQDTGLLVVMPATVALSCFASFSFRSFSMRKDQKTTDEVGAS